MTRVEGQGIVIRELNIIEKLVYKIKQFLDNRHYVFIDNEQELTRYMIEQDIWNNLGFQQGFGRNDENIDIVGGVNDKTRYNRTNFESHEGLNIKRFCRKLDLMLEL